MNMKKWISLLLALALCLGLCACGGEGGTNNPTDGPTAEPTAEPTVANDPNAVTITYHYNLDGMADSTVSHKKDSRLTTETPEVDGYVLLGWFTDEALTQSFSSGTKVSENLDLYAQWGVAHVLEAEYVDLSGFHGQGFSGGCDGAQAISMDRNNLNASNGVFLTYMYNNGLSITFEFTSDKAVEDATVIMRLSAEIMDISFSSSEFTVQLNGQTLNYSDISLVNGQAFEDFVVGTNCALKEGTNTITLTTTNSRAMAGTMYSTAPIIDCVKVVTSANIEMNAHPENMDKFSMD